MARAKLTVKSTTYKRKAWTDRYGNRHSATTVTRKSHKIKDRGELGRTPKRKRWFDPETHTGWDKDFPMAKRRRLVLKAHGRDLLASARGLQALANVQKRINPEVSRKARADALYFFKKYEKSKRK